jgi:hypothetical protein
MVDRIDDGEMYSRIGQKWAIKHLFSYKNNQNHVAWIGMKGTNHNMGVKYVEEG